MPDPANDPSGILNHVLERFQSLDVTGEIMIQDAHYKGTPNSDIHRGRWRRRDDKLVAVRQLRSYGFSDLTELHKSIALELRLWARLSHPNVLPLLGYCLNFGPYPALISEWMENGTVLEYLEKNKLADRFQMIQGVASGLHYLHEHDVVHSDLKCANVVVSPQGVPLLMDFGLSRLLVISSVIKTTKEMGGTLRWMARECFTGSDDDTLEERPTIATKETDIWALGVTAMEIITGELPYASAKSSGQIVADVISGKLPYKRAQGMDERLWRICAQCWSPIPSARPSMFEVVRALQGMQKTEEKCSQLIRGGMKSSIENVIQKFSTSSRWEVYCGSSVRRQ
ncbi:kinase-like protein [Rickenella mellea]|uniref:Kinase-like protein n=1 Tax=Rickenella mellea TaxID=50990 RepID=A0A4Y7PRY4_9AGAM|nr:kinase-like protein [Rickenella mellea]